MKKTSLVCLLLAGMLLCLTATACLAAATDRRIFDSADLLSPQEEEELEAEIVQFQKDAGMDFVLLTSDQPHGTIDQQTIADDYYDKYGFGIGDDHSGALYMIDLYEREHYLSTTGKMINIMTDARIDQAIDAVQPSLTAGDFAGGARKMLALLRGYVKAGIPKGQYQYDEATGERLTDPYVPKILTGGEILLAVGVALLFWVIFVLSVRRRYQLKGSTYRYDMRRNCAMNLTDQDDQFLRTATTQTPKPRMDDDRGGFGGGGGGSGVHFGSSGTSHGGGGGKF